jgi:alpha-galactosidase
LTYDNVSRALVINSTSFNDVGTYILLVTISDGLKNSTTTMRVTVFSTVPNTAPQFSSDLVDQIMPNNGIVQYMLPSVYDAEGNSITISLYTLVSWATINGSTIMFNRPPLLDVGTHTMSVVLSDGNAENSYNFNIFITNSAPRF